MANQLTVNGKSIRINPNDSSRIEYWHEGAGKWMDDGGVPGNIEDMDYDDKSKARVILYMTNGKKYSKDVFGGSTYEIKEKAPKKEPEERESKHKEGFSIFGKKSKDSYSSTDFSEPQATSKKKWPWWVYVLISPFWLIWMIIVVIWKIVKFIWNRL